MHMSAETNDWKSVWTAMLRLLTFKSTREELLSLNRKHLSAGLACAWLVGIGRYWDNPKANLLQHLGVGSVIYIFLLALLLWLIAKPMRPKSWTYFRVCTFVSLVSPPALLYAIPVEKVFGLDRANAINAWFLLLVAAWRVGLLFFFLRRSGQLGLFSSLTVTLLPLTFIVVALTMLNLERVVFDMMGGIREQTGTANDEAFGVLFMLSMLSMLLFLPLLICYIVVALYHRLDERPQTLNSPTDDERQT
jgi:hypothetical protein